MRPQESVVKTEEESQSPPKRYPGRNRKPVKRFADSDSDQFENPKDIE